MPQDIQYKCPTDGCDWIGEKSDMEAGYLWIYDADGNPDDEFWSNWICPKCQT